MTTETAGAGSAAPQTRRERHRQATYDEIVEVARVILREHDTVSLRGVATQMGMTPPALYRYVDGYDELLVLVAQAVYEDIIATMTEASQAQHHDDPGAQLVASAVAFRRWSLLHPAEFGLIFASNATSGSKEPDSPDYGGMAFSAYFSELYVRVREHYGFAVPSDDELPEELLAALQQLQQPAGVACSPDMSLGLAWIFMRAWSRLYGTVTLEVFRHLDSAVINSGALFVAMLEDNGHELNLGDDWPRLRALVVSQLHSPTHVT